MPNKHYYAIAHTYGMRTISASDGLPIGTILRFATELERDTWVNGERYEDGNIHREAISSWLARRLLENSFTYASDADVAAVLGRDAPHERSFWRKAATISQLWDVCNR